MQGDNHTSQPDELQGWNDSLEVQDERPIVAEQQPESQPPRQKSKRKTFIMVATAVLAVGVLALLAVQFLHKSKTQTTVVVNTQSLDNGTLNRLTQSSGSTTQTKLVIGPPTTFTSDVSVQGSGAIQKDLSVGGDTHIQGAVRLDNNLIVAKNVTVGGDLTVNGQITAGGLSVGSLTTRTITLSGDASIAGHLVPNGASPTIKASVASASGVATVTGNDTAGTVVVTTGHGSAIAGEVAIITFHTAFGTTPKVQLTPLNDASSKVNYYASRSATFFTLNTSSALAPDTQYAFDYLVTQ